MRYTVFLDRDGVINHDSEAYIRKPSDFHLLPGSAEAVARLNRAGVRVILITNQSIIGRGWASPDDLEAIFRKMTRQIGERGGHIDDIFFCPHRPDAGCRCRKPEPGMILAATEKHDIDLDRSCMVGDSAKDIETARRAGCAAAILVLTGNGPGALQSLEVRGVHPDHVTADLSAATDWILATLVPDSKPGKAGRS